jgi:phage-related protein
MEEAERKPLVWVGGCRADLRRFPQAVRRRMGYALNAAELGGKHSDAKPLRGFGGAGVLEIVEDFDRGTYRCVYTVRLKGRVYALHAFQKKATKGIATPERELDMVRRRLKDAGLLHRLWLESQGEGRSCIRDWSHDRWPWT